MLSQISSLLLLCYHYTSGGLKASSKKAVLRQVFYKKKLFLNFCNINRKTPLLETLFNKVADLQAPNFIKKRPQHRCFPANIAKFLRTVILKNIIERLLLIMLSYLGKALFQLSKNAFYFEFFNPREH